MFNFNQVRIAAWLRTSTPEMGVCVLSSCRGYGAEGLNRWSGAFGGRSRRRQIACTLFQIETGTELVSASFVEGVFAGGHGQSVVVGSTRQSTNSAVPDLCRTNNVPAEPEAQRSIQWLNHQRPPTEKTRQSHIAHAGTGVALLCFKCRSRIATSTSSFPSMMRAAGKEETPTAVTDPPTETPRQPEHHDGQQQEAETKPKGDGSETCVHPRHAKLL